MQRKIMLRKILIVGAIACFSVLAFGLGFGLTPAQDSPAQPIDRPVTSSAINPHIPAYHAHPPSGPLPATIDPKQFNDAETQNLYAIAARVKRVLYQEPCYCGCDKEAGHKSLLDCYVDRHAATCDVCKKEGAYAYMQTRRGKTAAQIRSEIVNGKWSSVDLSEYDTPASPKLLHP